jgi:hypothetical protein
MKRCIRRAIVLPLVMVVVAMLSLAAYTFAELMLTEYRAAIVHERQAQARALADSGMEYMVEFLRDTDDMQRQNGGRYNNPGYFQGMLVIDEAMARDRGRFCILAPNVEDGELAGVRYGFEDESARVNVNTLLLADKAQADGGRTLLMALPGMTEDVADAILDWIDPDDEQREFGAEIDYYSGLGYACKNGPLDTIEELLLVRGVTQQLLFGADLNRNGMVDASEAGTPSLAEQTASRTEVDRGWASYFTLYSVEANVQPDGTPRIDLNGSDMQKLHDDLAAVIRPEWADFIVAYRQFGAYTGNREGSTTTAVQLDYKQQPKTNLTSVLDLVGVKVEVRPPGQMGQMGEGEPMPMEDEEEGDEGAGESTILESPFPSDPIALGAMLPDLLDYVTVNKSPTIPGRININQASEVILRGIPGMNEEIVEGILGAREVEYTGNRPAHRHEHWILCEGIVTLDEMKKLAPFITGGGRVFRAQVVGYFDEEGPAARIEVVVNAAASASGSAPPRVVFWRDMTNLGRGYNLATLGVGAQ